MANDIPPIEHNLSSQQREELRRHLLDLVGHDEKSRQLAESGFQLVLEVAAKYIGKELELLDLAKAGNTGLVKAIEKFNPDSGFSFSTYAGWWIRGQITKARIDHQEERALADATGTDS